jgi:hypothetical protein
MLIQIKEKVLNNSVIWLKLSFGYANIYIVVTWCLKVAEGC